MTAALLRRAVERQNRTWSAMQEIRDRATAENRDMTAEERSSWDAAETELGEASSDIERFQRANTLDSIDRDNNPDLGGTGDGGSADEEQKRYAGAFHRYLTRGMQGLPDEDRALLEAHQMDLRAA